jgi:hypothetical protein
MKECLFLDFDGVLCDSVRECFVAAWDAWNLWRGAAPSTIPLGVFDAFVRMRPAVRTAADYLTVLQAVDDGKPFAAVDASLADAVRKEWHEGFYGARTRLYKHDRDWWQRLNPLYPGIDPETMDPASVYIVSTKKARFIRLILSNHGVEWPESHIRDDDDKKTVISDILDRTGSRIGLFVDDHLPNLRSCDDPRIRRFLAAWGYIDAERDISASRSEGIEVLSFDDFRVMLKAYRAT